MPPTVSVLLPVYNAAETLSAALDSTLSQVGVEFEVVAVDDGSVDGTSAILVEYALRDPRLRCLRIAHSGLVAALNHGLEQCQGEFVARMDGDDLMLPGRLSKQAAYLQKHPGLAGVACRVRREILPGGGIPPELTEGARRYLDWNNSLTTPEAIRREIFIESPLVHPSVMLLRAVLVENGGWREFDGPEDYELWLRLIVGQNLSIGKLRSVLHLWRDRAKSLTRTDERYRQTAFVATKVRYLAEYLLPDFPGFVVWGAGPVGKELMRAFRRLGKVPAAIVEVHPRRIGETIAGAKVIGLEQVGRFRDYLHLGAVGQPGARERIREQAAQAGLVGGENFFCCA
ncbi:glycosyltransferase [bacterium]|nr:glycosyltransferase [bacterium]